jgi:DNA polymerase
MAKADAALQEIAAQAAGCRRCPLYRLGTQTVFGQGPANAPLVLVGEQPGDKEDLAGLPFVGPAGRILDAGLAASGIDRTRVYVTNAVKHFKNVPRGKRRIHQRPNTYEIDRCRWWLDQELEIIKPRFTVALGATAAAALAGKTLTLAKVRGRPLTFREGVEGFVTVHPSYILRLRDRKKDDEYAHFIADLKALAKLVPEIRIRASVVARARRIA